MTAGILGVVNWTDVNLPLLRYMNNLRRFLARPATARRAALLAGAIAPLLKLSLRTRGYAATAQMLERVPLSQNLRTDMALMRAQAAYGAMRRLPFETTCLERSLVIWWLLGGGGSAQIRFGVSAAGPGESPDFHAWVEAEGTPIDDGTEHIGAFLPFTAGHLPQPDRFD